MNEIKNSKATTLQQLEDCYNYLNNFAGSDNTHGFKILFFKKVLDIWQNIQRPDTSGVVLIESSEQVLLYSLRYEDLLQIKDGITKLSVDDSIQEFFGECLFDQLKKYTDQKNYNGLYEKIRMEAFDIDTPESDVAVSIILDFGTLGSKAYDYGYTIPIDEDYFRNKPKWLEQNSGCSPFFGWTYLHFVNALKLLENQEINS